MGNVIGVGQSHDHQPCRWHAEGGPPNFVRNSVEGACVSLSFVKLLVTHSPSVTFGAGSLPEGASRCGGNWA